MRRYQLKYHVVCGFSFYERAEIKDMISYLKVIHNPDDSISLLRGINTPVRGIGKTTIETLERVALETGLSLWGAIGESIRRQLLPQRALLALKGFHDLIEDARAILAGTYVQRLEQTARESESAEAPAAIEMDDQIAFDPTIFEHNPDVSSPKPEELPAEGLPVASTAELLKFLIDRTAYIKQLEDEDTPESYSRIENLRELVNAAMDSRDRGETLDQFLDHAALVSDADAYDERAQITLMTLHAAKGLEFPLVFLCGLEEGLFPHSRTFLNPDDIEEERRLCYVGMTRAMDQLVITRAVYRRRYGTDMPEASVPSRFLDEIPAELVEELGKSRVGPATSPAYGQTGRTRMSDPHGQVRRNGAYASQKSAPHYAYEDEDQSAAWS